MSETMTPAQERMAKARAAKAVKSSAIVEDDVTGVEIPEGWLKVRILRLGDDRIFTGEQSAINERAQKGYFPRYKRNDFAFLPPELAASYEEKGWTETCEDQSRGE